MSLRVFAALPAILMLLAGNLVPAQEQPYLPFSGSGKIEKAVRGFIQMKNDADERYVIGIHPMNTRVTVTGTADPSFLTNGLWVRFSVELNKQGRPQGELTELTIVELSEVVQPGAQADLVPGEDAKEQEGPIPYIVVGQVRGLRNDNLQVAVPGKTLKLKLAEEAKITVDVSNYGLVRLGDEITVDGKQYQPGKVVADRVEIKLVEPLVGKGKKRARPKKDAQEAQEQKPAEDEKPGDEKASFDDVPAEEEKPGPQ
ncbi:MAG: hypothetical protein WD847_04180 [Pirellulales bacterium]